MRKLKLYSISSCRGCDDLNDTFEVEVNSYDELIEFVKENVIEDYDEWLEYMVDWLGDDEEDIIEGLVEGDYFDKWFNLSIGEESSLFCIEESYYNELSEESNVDGEEEFIVGLFNEFIDEVYG
jgi:hypothetical protein